MHNEGDHNKWNASSTREKCVSIKLKKYGNSSLTLSKTPESECRWSIIGICRHLILESLIYQLPLQRPPEQQLKHLMLRSASTIKNKPRQERMTERQFSCPREDLDQQIFSKIEVMDSFTQLVNTTTDLRVKLHR